MPNTKRVDDLIRIEQTVERAVGALSRFAQGTDLEDLKAARTILAEVRHFATLADPDLEISAIKFNADFPDTPSVTHYERTQRELLSRLAKAITAG